MDKKHCPKLRQIQEKLHGYLDKVEQTIAVDITRENIKHINLKAKGVFTDIYVAMHEANARVKHMQIKRITAVALATPNIHDYVIFIKSGGHMFTLVVDQGPANLSKYIFLNQAKLGLEESGFFEVILNGDLDLRDAQIDLTMFSKKIRIEGKVKISKYQFNYFGEEKWNEIEAKNLSSSGTIAIF